MRVLIIGSDDPWRMERGTQRALQRAGHVTKLFDDRKAKRLFGRVLTQRLALSQARRFKADFVLLSKCEALAPATVAQIIEGKQNAMWYHNAELFKNTYRPEIAHVVKIGKLAQTFFVSGFEQQWASLGLRAKFLPSCADAAIRPVTPEQVFRSDISFIGSADPSRASFLLKVANKYELKVWGTGWKEWRKSVHWTGRPVKGKDFAGVCSSSKIVLGVNPARLGPRPGNATSGRTWMTILAGGFFLGHGTPELKHLLREGDHCAWYTDVESCLTQCGYYLENAASRERIRREGRAFVRQFHTFDQRINNLLSGEAYVSPLV